VTHKRGGTLYTTFFSEHGVQFKEYTLVKNYFCDSKRILHLSSIADAIVIRNDLRINLFKHSHHTLAEKINNARISPIRM